MSKNPKKLMKLVNIDEENLHLLNDLRNFNEFFRKNVIYDNIKSHKKTGLHPLSRKYSYGKTTERWIKLSKFLLMNENSAEALKSLKRYFKSPE